MWLQYNILFHISQNYFIPSFIRSKLYMALDPMLQVSDILIYLAVIVSNTIHTIVQALTEFSKPGTYGE